MADIFQVGYGKMWLPPPQRADGGSFSVGYDLFDRFDLGRPRNETLYGTETGLKTSISAAHDASVKMYTDFIPNHNGFRNKNTTNFRRARRLSRIRAVRRRATPTAIFTIRPSAIPPIRSTAACSA